MIELFYPDEVKQGSPEWHELRNGLLTGTDAYDILNGKGYEQIIAKKVNNSWSGNYYTRRGHVLEEEARGIYSEVYNPITEIGFVKNDKFPLCGYSPDGFIGGGEECGLWECKAFNPERHLKVAENLDSHIVAQIQFGLMVTEFEWCDLTLYNPDVENLDEKFIVKRIFANMDIQNALKENLEKFAQNA